MGDPDDRCRIGLWQHACVIYNAGNIRIVADMNPTTTVIKPGAAMEDDSNERFVSHASAWETAIKVSIGKLALLTD